MLPFTILEKPKSKKKFQKSRNVQLQNVEVDKTKPIQNLNVEKPSQGPNDFQNSSKLKNSSQDNGNVSSNENIGKENKFQRSWLSVVKSAPKKVDIAEAFPCLPGSRTVGHKNFAVQDDKSTKFPLSQGISGANDQKNVDIKNTTIGEGVVKKKKAKSSKKPPVPQPQRNPNKKKRSDPVVINFMDFLELNKTKKKKEPKVIKNKFSKHKQVEHLSGNLLDASNPKRSRGKHREIKKKKLSNLKLSIIKERIIKQKMRERAVAMYLGKDFENLIESIDFKVEIQKYLNELSQRKVNKTENNENKPKENTKSEKKNENGEENLNSNIKKEDKFGKVEEKTTETILEGNSTLVVQSCKEVKFSSKLREYCDNVVTPALNSEVSQMIKELINLQDKMFARDPIKAKARRRHVSGIKEVKKHLMTKKVKMIVMAPNLEKLQMQGSVFDLITELKSMADTQNVPYVFALDRYKLGRCTRKNVPVSAFAVLNYDGIENRFENVLQLVKAAKKDFAEMTSKPQANDLPEVTPSADKTELEDVKQVDVNAQVISSLMSAIREDLHISENVKSEA